MQIHFIQQSLCDPADQTAQGSCFGSHNLLLLPSLALEPLGDESGVHLPRHAARQDENGTVNWTLLYDTSRAPIKSTNNLGGCTHAISVIVLGRERV